jgi:hypothetical protein
MNAKNVQLITGIVVHVVKLNVIHVLMDFILIIVKILLFINVHDV